MEAFSSSAVSSFFVRGSPATIPVVETSSRPNCCPEKASLFVRVQPPFQRWKLRLVPIAARKKSGLLHSQPKSTVGTPAYIPEVLLRKEYDDPGKQSTNLERARKTISCTLQHALQ